MHQVSAAEEFAKNPELKQEDLITLQTWLSTQKHLPAITDEMLILFLHSQYYDIEKTKQHLETYYTMRTKHSHLFSKRDASIPLLKEIYQNYKFAVSPRRDPDGNLILFHTFKGSNSSLYIQPEIIKLMLMVVDSAFLQHGTVEGFVIYADMQDFSFSHFIRMGLHNSKFILQYTQDGCPFRLKGVHILNVVPLADTVLALARPFMKKEFMEILHIHSGGLETFHKFIPKAYLPSDYEGDLESVEEISDKYYETVQNLADYFAEEEKCRVDETKRAKKNRSWW